MATLVEHLIFVSPRAAHELAKMHGLLVLNIRIAGSPFPLGTASSDFEDQGLHSLPFESWNAIGTSENAPGSHPVDHRSRAKFCSTLGSALSSSGNSLLANAMRASINLFALGDHIEVILQKP
jgi:hypothetical protein